LLGCQAVVVVTFAYSAATKVAGRAAYADFRGWLASAAGVPRSSAATVGAATVALEAAAAGAVLVPALAPAGFAVACVLLAAFSAGVRSMIRRRVAVPCRCFGAGRRPPGPAHLVRNAVLFAVAALGGALAAVGTAPPPVGAAAVLACVAGATAALLLVNLDELVVLHRPLNRS
jgi:hypothetical protein